MASNRGVLLASSMVATTEDTGDKKNIRKLVMKKQNSSRTLDVVQSLTNYKERG